MKRLFSFLFVVVVTLSLYGQESNPVIDANINAKYTGKIKKGLAHGKGIAEGIDKYEGYFIKGMKSKKGKYTFSNGDVYQGEFENDKMHGEGILYSAGTVIKGYWKEGVFKGESIDDFNGYRIISSANVSYKPQFRKLSDADRKIKIDIRQKNNDVSNIIVNDYSSGKVVYSGNKVEFNMIQFPFKASMQYEVPNKSDNFKVGVLITFEILEEGLWSITFNN